jgi:hypothetical protein
MLTVPAVVPALNVSDAPVPEMEPSEVLERDQVYEIPEDGQVLLHAGVAVNGVELLVAT